MGLSVSSRWRRTLVWSSLFLNIILILFIMLGPFHHGPGKPPPPPHKMTEFMGRDLKGEDARIYAEIRARHEARMEASGEKMHKALDHMSDVMQADNVSADQLQAAQNQIVLAREEMDNAIFAFMSDVAERLSVEGRQKLRLGPKGPPPMRD